MAVDFTVLQGERLILRRFRQDDLEPFQAYRADPAVAMYQGWSAGFSLQDAQRFVARESQARPGQLGIGAQIAIELRRSGAMIGDVLLDTPEREPQEAYIGFTLASQYQGQGYATEAVRTLLDYVFGVLKKHRVIAITYAQNTRSVALLERIGMRREAHFVRNQWFHGRWVDEYVYAVLDSEWPPGHSTLGATC